MQERNQGYVYSSIQAQKQALFCPFTRLSITLQLLALRDEFLYQCATSLVGL